jgi:hypothetical protein
MSAYNKKIPSSVLSQVRNKDNELVIKWKEMENDINPLYNGWFDARHSSHVLANHRLSISLPQMDKLVQIL